MPSSTIIANHIGTVSRQQFFGEVAAHQLRLPTEMRYAINLCESRQSFMTAFAAVTASGHTNLLANNDKTATLQAIQRSYARSYFIIDSDIALPDDAIIYDMRNAPNSPPATENPLDAVAGEHEAVITFTSGSTGAPAPWAKSWNVLQIGARLAAQRFAIDATSPTVLVATVPHQHMYGLEIITMLALEGYAISYESKPFYPQDIAQACTQATSHLPADTALTLVTTPIHLKSLVQDDTALPPLHRIISATAPLSPTLASEAEQRFNTEVHEIYGCTEAGSIASRRTTATDRWKPYDDYRLRIDDKGHTTFLAPQFSAPVLLTDNVSIDENGEFLLLGRHADMINIGGKRASLAGLNALLQQMPNIKDGAFVQQPSTTEREARLSLIVAMKDDTPYNKTQLLSQLGQSIDGVFLPRQIVVVDALPRNAVGKLQQAEITALLAAQKRAQHA